MGHEANMDSIRVLEKQIEEGKGDVIKLKRARNAFLNISTHTPKSSDTYLFAASFGRRIVGRIMNNTLLGYKRVPTTSFSFPTTGSRLHPAPRGFGASGGTLCGIGRDTMAAREPPPLTWYWTEIDVMSPSMDPSEMESGVALCRAPYNKSTYSPTMVTP